MALVKLGPMVGQASGRLGAIVFARNRYGAYSRNGSIPITSTTPYALEAKARMTAASQAWQNLDPADKLAWNAWAQSNPTTNKLGDSIILTGAAAYIGIACRLAVAGEAALDTPPIAPAPAPLTSLTLSADIGIGTFDLAYTATPLGATEKLWVLACSTDSKGINFVANMLRFVGLSAAAQASPFDIQTEIETRFGSLAVGQVVHVSVYVFDTATGQLSAPLRNSAEVVETA